MSAKYDKYKQVRLLPETVKLLDKFRKQSPFTASVPKVANAILQGFLKERVK